MNSMRKLILISALFLMENFISQESSRMIRKREHGNSITTTDSCKQSRSIVAEDLWVFGNTMGKTVGS